jgi:hypothetical protein
MITFDARVPTKVLVQCVEVLDLALAELKTVDVHVGLDPGLRNRFRNADEALCVERGQIGQREAL